MTGCWLSATRSTATAQTRCNMYRLPTTEAIAANPIANNAKTANSSHAKYVCRATSAARNIHIHFRPVSLVFIFPLSVIPYPLNPSSQLMFRVLLIFFVPLLRCATLPRGSKLFPPHLYHLTPFGPQ